MAWYWHDCKDYASSIEIAEQVDICISIQMLIKKVLKNTESVVLDPIGPGIVEWTAEAAAAVWRQGQFEEPIDRLFVDFWQKQGAVQRDGEFEKLLSDWRDFEICYLQDGLDSSVHSSEIRSLQRFKSKVSYCGFVDSGVDHPWLLFRIFEALLWGQIPIVSGNWSDWDEVLSPDVQAQLPVVECVRDPVVLQAAFEVALVRFDAEELEGELIHLSP